VASLTFSDVGADAAGAATAAQAAAIAAIPSMSTIATDPALRAAFVSASGAGNGTVFLGDSITASGDGQQLPGLRWPELVSARSMGRIRWAHNAGIGGNTTAQMLARLSTDVLAYKPRFCTVLGGTNDADAAAAISGLTSLYTQLRAAGVEPIALTMPPQDTDPGGKACQVNAWIHRYAEAHRIAVVDIYPLVVDPTTGRYVPSLTKDGTHPSPLGDDKIATAVLNAIQPLYAPWTPYLAPSQIDSVNLCPNPCLVDTRLAGDGVTPIPSDPLHWVSFLGDATTASMVTQAGVPGRMHQLVVASTETSSSNVPMAKVDGSDDFPIPVTPGHTIRFSMRVQTVNALTNGVLPGVSLQFGGEGSYHGVNHGGNGGGEIADGVWSMDVLVPAGATGARFIWGCSAPTTPTSATTLRFGQPTFVDLGVL
jgi:lysophospholipase L1-like esterase